MVNREASRCSPGKTLQRLQTAPVGAQLLPLTVVLHPEHDHLLRGRQGGSSLLRITEDRDRRSMGS